MNPCFNRDWDCLLTAVKHSNLVDGNDVEDGIDDTDGIDGIDDIDSIDGIEKVLKY